MANKKPTSLTQKQKDNIIELFFARVTNTERARKIIRVASALADEPDDDAFYSAIYKYSLAENWPNLERDYDEFVIPGDFGVANIEMLNPRRARKLD